MKKKQAVKMGGPIPVSTTKGTKKGKKKGY